MTSIEINALPSFFQRLSRTKTEAVLKGLRQTANVDANRYIQQAINAIPPKKRPVYTGDYQRAWKSQDTPDGAIFYSTSSPAVKAGVIEYGRRPGKGIPSEPLMQWVRIRLGISDPKLQRSLAYLISRKAKHQGRPGLHIVESAYPKIREAAVKNVREALARAK